MEVRQNVVVYMARGYEYDRIGNDGITHDALRTEERQLYDTICEIVGQAEGVGTGDLIVDVIPDLGQQTLLYVACYNGGIDHHLCLSCLVVPTLH